MPSRSVLRLLPSVAVLGLLALAAAAPRQAALRAAPPAFLQPGVCSEYVESAPGDSGFAFGTGSGVSQPLLPNIAVAACSVSVQASGWTWLRLDMVEWDPLSLAPEANTVALRSQLLDPSDLQYYTLNRTPRVNFVPPIVSQSVAGVADPPSVTVSADMKAVNSVFPATFTGHYDPAGAATLPSAYIYQASGPRTALPGGHPVLAHAVCDNGGELPELRVAQAVTRTDLVLEPRPKELLQRFRVPGRCELRWVEFPVVPATNYDPAATATVSIRDGGLSPEPDITLPSPQTEAFFMVYGDAFGTPSHWASDNGFDHAMVLEPGHDYWLAVTNGRAMGFHTRVLDGSESADFTGTIGGFFARDTSIAAWTAQTGKVLSFKIVALPLPSSSVPPPAIGAGFALRVSPNPARDLADVRWSGAVGPVRLEVLDARGRRVASAAGGAAGAWRFTRAGRSGAALPAGVYFVHARDSAGGHAVERVVFLY
jgi:hypothetical protein